MAELSDRERAAGHAYLRVHQRLAEVTKELDELKRASRYLFVVRGNFTANVIEKVRAMKADPTMVWVIPDGTDLSVIDLETMRRTEAFGTTALSLPAVLVTQTGDPADPDSE